MIQCTIENLWSISLRVGLPSVAILPWLCRKWRKRIFAHCLLFTCSHGKQWLNSQSSPRTWSTELSTWPCQANTRHWTKAGLLLGQRRRRWPNNKPALVQCLEFTTWALPPFRPNPNLPHVIRANVKITRMRNCTSTTAVRRLIIGDTNNLRRRRAPRARQFRSQPYFNYYIKISGHARLEREGGVGDWPGLRTRVPVGGEAENELLWIIAREYLWCDGPRCAPPSSAVLCAEVPSPTHVNVPFSQLANNTNWRLTTDLWSIV